MGSDWRPHSLGDLVDIKHGFAFKSSNFSDEPTNDILLTPGNFAIGGGFKYDKLKYYDGDVPEEYILNPGDLLVTMTDLSKQADTLGFPAIVPETHEMRYLHNQRLGLVEIRQGIQVDKVYLFYLLCSREYRHEVIAGATGTTVKHTAPKRIAAFKFLLPPYDEQRAIAHILGSLDDKIELKRQMNETLEAMARAIFKSWFVDFDPVRAKMEGSDPSLPDEIAALFPDSFEDSEIGPIPKGWKVKEIRECCSKIQNGGTPKRSESDYWTPGTIPWLTSGEVRQTLITTTENMISELGLKKSSAKWLPKNSAVVALYGATAGQVALISSKMTTNQAVCGLIPKASFRYFNYLSLDRSVEILANLARGSAQQNISKGIVETTKVIIPRADILESFDHVASPMFDKWIANLQESKSLASLRDTLLPKLISGELHVPNAEEIFKNANIQK